MTTYDGMGIYYYLNIKKIGLIAWHPFSVSEYKRIDNSNNVQITFHIKVNKNQCNNNNGNNFILCNNNTWTENLAKYIEKYNIHDIISNNSNTVYNIPISLDGPYGNIILNPHIYNTMIILIGGIGITPMLPILETFLYNNTTQHNHDKRNSILQRIEVIWAVRGYDMISVFSSRLHNILIMNNTSYNNCNNYTNEIHNNIDDKGDTDLNNHNIHKLTYNIHITIYDTSRDRMDNFLSPNEVMESNNVSPSQNGAIEYRHGRPNINNMISAIVSPSSSDTFNEQYMIPPLPSMSDNKAVRLSNSKECLLICGPDDFKKTCILTARRCDLDYHNESFSY
jgi:hypothetical protein